MSTSAETVLADVEDDASRIVRLLKLARDLTSGLLAGKELTAGERDEIEAVIEGAKAIAERQRRAIDHLGRRAAA